MAFDRRITIHIEAPGHSATVEEAALDDDLYTGDYVPGPVTSYPLWAERRSAGSNDQPTTGGFITVSVQNYTVRWFQALELANLALVMVEDEFGQIWDPDSVAPGDARRRLITLQCIRTT